MEVRAFAMLLGIAGVVAGVVREPTPPLPACPESPVSTQSWRADSTNTSFLRVPPQFGPRTWSGIDSEMWTWTSDRGRLTSDYGFYSGPYRRPSADSVMSECIAVVALDSIRIVTYKRGDSLGLHAWWPRELERPRYNGAQRTLSMWGVAADMAALEQLRAVVWSVERTH